MGRTHLTLLLWIIHGNMWKKNDTSSGFKLAKFLLVHTTNNGRRPSPLSWTSYSRRFQNNRQSQRRYNFIFFYMFICLWNTQSSHALKLSYISNMIDAVIVTRELQIIKISWCINVVFFFMLFVLNIQNIIL